ncbi:MAG: hypothetical protein ACYTXI_41025 [Nostoc sp.]
MVAQLTRRCNKWLLLVPIALLVRCWGLLKSPSSYRPLPHQDGQHRRGKSYGHTGDSDAYGGLRLRISKVLA